MNENSRLDARQWIKAAQLDLRAGEKALRGDDPIASDACFHAQQAAEKFFKAFLMRARFTPDGRMIWNCLSPNAASWRRDLGRLRLRPRH